MRSGQTCDLLKFVNSSLCCGINVQIIFEVTFSSFRGYLEIIFFDNLNIFHPFNKIEFRLIRVSCFFVNLAKIEIAFG